MIKLYFSILFALFFGSLAVANYSNSPYGNPNQQKQIEIFDHGLQVPIFSMTVPPGWQVNQNIATDINDVWRMYRFYTLDFYGPNGEFVTRLFPIAVYPSQGQNWEQEWWQLFFQRLGRLGNFNLGPTVQSPLAPVLFSTSFRAGIPVFERHIQGSLSGRAVEGKLFALIANNGYSILLYASVILSPKGLLNQTVDVLAFMTSSSQQNPQYQLKSQQLIAQRTQQHQMIMQSNRNWFNQHMETMRSISEQQSQSNRGFSEYLKSIGYSNVNQETYTTTDRFTDYIRDTTTFADPYSGHRVTQQGQYDYWYTDRLGNYHGTNDPNFKPGQLNGDWSRIMPLGQ